MSQPISPSDLRAKIDDLDDVYRAAAEIGNMEEVFARERKQLDLLMVTSRTFHKDPIVMGELRKKRFVFTVAEVWHEAKRNPGVILDRSWWKRFSEVLRDFDNKNPDCHRMKTPSVSSTTSVRHADILPDLRYTRKPSQPTPPAKPRQLTPPARLTQPAPPAAMTQPAPPVKKSQPAPPAKPSQLPQPSQSEPPVKPSQPKAPAKTYERAPPAQAKTYERAPPAPATLMRTIRSAKPVDSSSNYSYHGSSSDSESDEGAGDIKGKGRMVGERPKEDLKRAPTGKDRGEGRKQIRVQEERGDEKKRKRKAVEENSEEEEIGDVKGKKRASKHVAPKPTGLLRSEDCKRCVRLEMDCMEQVGGRACVACATIKVKCVDISDPQPEPATKPNKKKVSVVDDEPEPAARPVKKSVRVEAAPVATPGPEKKSVIYVKARAPPAPTPASKAKRSKTMKSAAVIDVDELDDNYEQTFGQLDKDIDDDIYRMENDISVINYRLTTNEKTLRLLQDETEKLRETNVGLHQALREKDVEIEELHDRFNTFLGLHKELRVMVQDEARRSRKRAKLAASVLEQQDGPRAPSPQPPSLPSLSPRPAPLTQLPPTSPPVIEELPVMEETPVTQVLPAPVVDRTVAEVLPHQHQPATITTLPPSTVDTMAAQMPPPPPPTAPPSPPAVTLQPPTPHASSQENIPVGTTHLEVPVGPPEKQKPRPRSTSRSPAPPASHLRRSPRHSPDPTALVESSSKRPGDALDERAAKKARE